MTKYIAYTMALNQPGLPNGFITSHFATDQSSLDGYYVVPLDTFNSIFQHNVTLIRQQEVNSGVLTVAPNTPAPVPRPATDAEHVPANFVSVPATPAPNTPITMDHTALFNQFMAWIAAGKPGSPPSNT